MGALARVPPAIDDINWLWQAGLCCRWVGIKCFALSSVVGRVVPMPLPVWLGTWSGPVLLLWSIIFTVWWRCMLPESAFSMAL